MVATVRRVSVEHHRDPIGIGEATPRLSWQVDAEPGWRQGAYEVELANPLDERWSSGAVRSADSVLVPWPGRPLESRDRRSVRVRVWAEGDVEPSAWSAPLLVEAGLLTSTAWSARRVTAGAAVPADDQPALLFRREFVVSRPVVCARLYVTAHGVYEPSLNGAVVGDHVLAPGWTPYAQRLRYQTFDVGERIVLGPNVLGMAVADGWFRGHLGFTGEKAFYGDRLAAVAQLEIEHTDGARTVVVTDDTWRWSRSSILTADLYHGETCDLRLEEGSWSHPGFDDSSWSPAAAEPLDSSGIVAPTGPPVRRIETISPVEILRSPTGALLVDFGVNLVGRVRLRLPDAPAGTEIRVRHAEVLEHGELGTRPLRAARATDVVLLDGRGPRTWEPSFTFHGFRYAEVAGWPGELTTSDLDAVVLHTDLERTGTFSCSEPDVVTLHDNIVRGMRGNFLDVPTDCPQRDERLGWTGDLTVFAPTAQFLFDTSGMLTSWLRDLAAEQHEGVVPLFVPFLDIMPPQFPRWPVEAGWGDAAVVVPWVLFERSGDRDLLAGQWDSMADWLRVFAARAGRDLDFPDGGMMLGDWLDSAAPDDEPWKARVPWQLVATAYLARSARIVARAAEVLGRRDDVARFADLGERAAARFRSAYVAPDGHLVHHAQTAYALALQFDLLDPAQRAAAGADLAAQVEADGFRIGTGFLGTPFVCDALTDAGEVETAYSLLLQRECPSWLYAVTLGATTVWERWNSMLPDGSINPGEMTSFNHYAFGSVADWLHRAVAGLAPAAPGYRRLAIAPRPGGGISWASASHLTPYGEASVAWRVDAGTFALDLVVPPGTSAEVRLPDGTTLDAVGSGEHRFTCAMPTPPPRPARPTTSGVSSE